MPLAVDFSLWEGTAFTAWPRGTRLTFPGYTRSETLTNIPLLVTLSTNIPGFSYADFANPFGGDLRFTDETGTTELSYEIEQWNTNGTSLVWVRVPLLTTQHQPLDVLGQSCHRHPGVARCHQQSRPVAQGRRIGRPG